MKRPTPETVLTWATVIAIAAIAVAAVAAVIALRERSVGTTCAAAVAIGFIGAARI